MNHILTLPLCAISPTHGYPAWEQFRNSSGFRMDDIFFDQIEYYIAVLGSLFLQRFQYWHPVSVRWGDV